MKRLFSILNNCSRLAYSTAAICIIPCFVPNSSLGANLHYVLVDSASLPNNNTAYQYGNNALQYQVADLDRDGLDEAWVLFPACYSAYSFANDSIVLSDSTNGVRYTGILATNLDDNSIPDLLIVNAADQLSLRSNLSDSGFRIIDTLPGLGGYLIGSPGATLQLRDMNGDGYQDLVMSQLAEYDVFIGRYWETNFYQTGDVGAYDLANHQLLWGEFGWHSNWVPSYPSAQYSTCFDRDGLNHTAIAAWGMHYHEWWERGPQDYWVRKTSIQYDLSVYDQAGNARVSRWSPSPIFALSGDFVPSVEGEEIVVVFNGISLDSVSFPHSAGVAMYCVNLAADTPTVVWAHDCLPPSANALFWYDTSRTSFVYCTSTGVFQVIQSSNGTQIGTLDGLKPSLDTKPCHAIATGSAKQIFQMSGNLLSLYQLSEPTDVTPGDPVKLPDHWSLDQNYPNPFNPTTRISFAVPRPSQITLSVFNISGQLVTVLMDEHKSVGEYSVDWDGTDGTGRRVASGAYFYRLQSDGKTLSKKMLLLK
jgi:hypothetical protein